MLVRFLFGNEGNIRDSDDDDKGENCYSDARGCRQLDRAKGGVSRSGR